MLRVRSVSTLPALAAGLLLLAVPAAQGLPGWTRIGGTGVAAGLAGPAGRPVDAAWFSADGRRLFAALKDGTLWSSEDAGRTWEEARREPLGPKARLDREDGIGFAEVLRNPYRAGVLYALGEHLYRSDDGGGEWTNLTAAGGVSIIGEWQDVLAISPSDPDLIVVGNSMGLWKSHDSGVTWSSLNARLPNFPEARFVDVDAAGALELDARRLGPVALARTAAGAIWRAAPALAPPAMLAPPSKASPGIHGPMPPGYEAAELPWEGPVFPACPDGTACGSRLVTAMASSGHLWAGTSDGRIWVSRDDGAQWSLSWNDPEGRAVTRIWADPALPHTALALASGRVLRSTNAGTSWFDISSDLPEAEWTALAGDTSAGTVYVGGPLGVFFARTDLHQPGPAGAWAPISDGLPSPTVGDLALEPLRGRLYAALPGHGIYWTRTPQVEQALRVVSSADLGQRPAAPGSLLTVLGGPAFSVRADGKPAPVLDTGGDQTQVQVPYGVEGRSVRLRLDARGESHLFDMQLRRVSPAVFVVGGDPLILDAGTGALVGWRRPAVPGGSVLVMATGLGEVSPSWPAGVPSPDIDPPQPIARIQARIGGVPAQVLSSYLASGYVGIYVVEVAVPPDAQPGSVRLTIEADGQPSNRVPLVIGR